MVSSIIIVFCIVSVQLLGSYCSPLPWQTASIVGDGPNVANYVNYDDLSFSKESGVFEEATETNVEEQPIHVHAVVKRSDVLGPRLQSVALLVPASVGDDSDMEVAESHLFRPVFRYKSQYTERRRVRQLPSQFGKLVVQ